MAPDASFAAVLGLGFLLGLQHATDPDHLAAVSSLASRHRSVLGSALLGSAWGAGHTLALVGAGAATMALRLTISPALERALEGLVGMVLIGLGGPVALRALRAIAVHRHAHAHGGDWHDHRHVHLGSPAGHDHAHGRTIGARPFLVGLLHGLAGSAALMVLVVSTTTSPLAGVLYLIVFGAGSTAGMVILSGLVGLPFAVASRRSAGLHRLLRLVAGLAGVALGVWLLTGLAGLRRGGP
jgi:ABC-type nickel/cobalt efflux system permease component RcnA